MLLVYRENAVGRMPHFPARHSVTRIPDKANNMKPLVCYILLVVTADRMLANESGGAAEDRSRPVLIRNRAGYLLSRYMNERKAADPHTADGIPDCSIVVYVLVSPIRRPSSVRRSLSQRGNRV